MAEPETPVLITGEVRVLFVNVSVPVNETKLSPCNPALNSANVPVNVPKSSKSMCSVFALLLIVLLVNVSEDVSVTIEPSVAIDTLLSGEQKKSIIYNETPDSAGTPKGYDLKALTLDVDNRVNVQKKLQMGAYNTRRIVFDPFNNNYEVQTMDAFNTEEKLKLGGERLPILNDTLQKMVLILIFLELLLY